ncbi:MAG: hypothetical protein IPP87_23830 [Ideonella sp.]|nr:hypothetical protein [Ideonella sp.]
MPARPTRPALASASFPDPRAWPWLLGLALGVAALTALAPHYEASGVQVMPLAAALVLALAATALWGWRTLPAVAVGAALGSLGWPPAAPTALEVVAAVTLVLQVAAGGLLLRRSGRTDDLALDTRPAIRRLLAAALACGLIGGLLHMLADMVGSADPTLRPGTLLLVRTLADAASIVIGLPVLLAFFSPQRARWMPRRRMVAVPLLALLGLMLVAFALIDERDRQQAQSRFERDAEIVLARTQALLDAPVQTLLALQGAFSTAPGGSLSAAEFDGQAQPWMRRSLGVGSVGWMEMAPPPATAASGAATGPPRRRPRRARRTSRPAGWARADAAGGGLGAVAHGARSAGRSAECPARQHLRPGHHLATPAGGQRARRTARLRGAAKPAAGGHLGDARAGVRHRDGGHADCPRAGH